MCTGAEPLVTTYLKNSDRLPLAAVDTNMPSTVRELVKNVTCATRGGMSSRGFHAGSWMNESQQRGEERVEFLVGALGDRVSSKCGAVVVVQLGGAGGVMHRERKLVLKGQERHSRRIQGRPVSRIDASAPPQV